MEAAELTRQLEEFNQEASEVLRDVHDITKQQVRHWIVNPLLVTLGWDPLDKKQVFLDYPIPSGGPPADYALLDDTGKPRLIIDVKSPGETVTESDAAVAQAKAVGAPLVLITNGHEFSLWHCGEGDSATPLFALPLKELPASAEGLLGLTAPYRLSDTGIEQLRRTAIRTAALQILEENSEKTFDAIVEWTKTQIAPGARLDTSTEQAIREATLLWLNEEYLGLPGFERNGHKSKDLRVTSPREWAPFPRGPPGTFQYRFDQNRTLDVRQSAKDVKQALREQGFRTLNATSFGGFYTALRDRAGLGTTN
jgi:hypothetical protein